MINLLKKYEKLTEDYRTLHRKCSEYYSNLNTNINVSNIVLVALVSITNNITSVSRENNIYLSVSYSVLLYLSAMVSTLQQFLKYEELSEKHKTSSTRYNHLYNLVLLTDSNDDIKVKLIIEECENIYNSSPNIPEKILKTIEDCNTNNLTPTSINNDEVDTATAYQLSRLMVSSYTPENSS